MEEEEDGNEEEELRACTDQRREHQKYIRAYCTYRDVQ